MIQEAVERRSEFRFPVVVPVEYFPPDDSSLLSYTLDLSGNGAFISSDDRPLGIGIRFGMNLNLPFDEASSRIFRTEGTVIWNRMQPFKSKRNGMGVRFIKALPESLLLNALAGNVERLMKETEAKKLFEEKVERLQSELERAKRLVALGSYAEKILLDLSNPLLALSGQLEIIKMKMHEHKRSLEEREETDKRTFRKMIPEFDKSCKEIDKILGDYTVISELAHIVRDDRETLQRRLRMKYKS